MIEMMKAAVVHEFGTRLRIEEVRIPTPGPGRQGGYLTEASTHVLVEQTERSTVTWQISREGTVPALATVYRALGGSWKRKDEEWRAPK